MRPVEWLMKTAQEQSVQVPITTTTYTDIPTKASTNQWLTGIPFALASSFLGGKGINALLRKTRIGASPWIQENPLVQVPLHAALALPGLMAAGAMMRRTGQFEPNEGFLYEPKRF